MLLPKKSTDVKKPTVNLSLPEEHLAKRPPLPRPYGRFQKAVDASAALRVGPETAPTYDG